MKTKQCVILLVLTLLFCGLQTAVPAKAEVPFVKAESSGEAIELIPGEVNHLVIPISLGSDFYFVNYGSQITVNISTDTGLFDTVKGFLSSDGKGYSPNAAVGIEYDKVSFVEFDLFVKETARIGSYRANIHFTFSGYDIGSSMPVTEADVPFTVRIANELTPAMLSADDFTYDANRATAGGSLMLDFSAINGGEMSAYNAFVTADFGTSGLIPEYIFESVKVGNLLPGEARHIRLPVSVLSDAEPGVKAITLQFRYKDLDGTEHSSQRIVYVTLAEQSVAPDSDAKLRLTSSSFNAEVEPNSKYTVAVTVENVGKKTAKNINVTVGENGIGIATGILALYPNGGITISALKPGESTEVALPLAITKSVNMGLTELEILVSYEDSQKNPIMTIQKEYLTISERSDTDTSVTERNDIRIENFSQSPDTPIVNETVTVSFDVVNNGTKAVKEFRIKGVNLTSNGFEPIFSEIYKTVGTIEAGERQRVSMTYRVGSDISEGFNTLSLEFSYVDGNNEPRTESTSCYVLNVKNVSSANTSRPKLLISDFTTGEEQLRAGAMFPFTFSMKNTHPTKMAKNIKITVTQAEGIFSNVSGSNSFYVDAIAPGEAYEQTMEMKVRSDTATGAYDVTIDVEYEYDDMSQVDANAGGVTDRSTIRLQAVENARPAVQNLMLGYYWDTVKVNQSTNLTFDFYNMGRSSLNNVYVTLDGDFSFEMGQMHIIGSVPAGSSSPQEVSIIPMREGMCSGVLTVFFEDSNGDVASKEFPLPETYVEADYVDMGGFDPGWDMPSVDVEVPVAKNPLMPLWVYIAALVAALGLGLLVTRGVMISIHKKKLRKEDI